MEAVLEGNTLVIRIPANTVNPPPSSSGKSRLVASDSQKTSIQVLGKQLKVAVNAYIT